jgi:glycosyltransferase involved in cell wall biosynthesis
MSKSDAIFLINLLQDVSIVRPLVYMTARDLGLRTTLLVSQRFLERDKSGIWLREVSEISCATSSEVMYFEHEWQALQTLRNKSGALVAGSESSLNAHTPINEIFRSAPSSFLTVTLQHGFECVGFLQNREHDAAHGQDVTFFANVVCGWCESSRLKSMAPSQQPKLYVSGPPGILQMSRNAYGSGSAKQGGLVCENLHSVRLNVSGDFKNDFISTFRQFCETLAAEGKEVTLRPHPGGQFVVKNDVSLPANVKLNNSPIYKVDLSQFAYGISPPSSVVIDMVLAGVPVAVWHDGSGIMDTSNFAGLTHVSSFEDCLAFSREAVTHSQKFIQRQQAFLEEQRMPFDPVDVYGRFARLLSSTTNHSRGKNGGEHNADHVMFIANANIPTLQLSFLKPLAPIIESGDIVASLLTEEDLATLPKNAASEAVQYWIDQRFSLEKPNLIVFCRYSGPHAEVITKWACAEDVPVIYHIDDDLLHVPKEIGLTKFRAHNRPERLRTVRHLLDNADLVYCSTISLKKRLRSLGFSRPMVIAKLYCSAEILVPAVRRSCQKVGYMGFDHVHDLATVVPAIVEFLRRNSSIIFELFGSIPKPSEFDEFGDRVVVIPPVRDYQNFMLEFAKREWDVGICPLVDMPFNEVKANTKWVEYTSVGAAVIATAGTIYDECCAGGCGILAQTSDEWLAALELLARDADARLAQVTRAQQKLAHSYSVELLRKQVLDVFENARRRVGPRRRILIVSADDISSLHPVFIDPLAPLVREGKLAVSYLTARQMEERTIEDDDEQRRKQIIERLEAFRPTLVILCRHNGVDAERIIEWAKRGGVPVIFRVDDNLLGTTSELQTDKFKHDDRLAQGEAGWHLLDQADLIYCSTNRLLHQLQSIGIQRPLIAGDIDCCGRVVVPAILRPVRKIGYIASGEDVRSFETIIPALVQVLHRFPEVELELFGPIPHQAALAEFGIRVIMIPDVELSDSTEAYEGFLSELAKREWDIGLCPLTLTTANLVKASTRWIEYTSVGTAVIASRQTAYDECCANGCGILVDSVEDWLAALERLAGSPAERYAQATRAQEKLAREYSPARLRGQLVDVFDCVERANSVAFANSPSSVSR